MNKQCETVREQLPLYIDRLLTEEEQAGVKAHLAGCLACEKELEFLEGIQRTAASLPELSVSDSFRAGLKEKLAEVEKQPKLFRKKRFLPRYISGAVAAAAVIAFSIVSFQSLPEHPDLTPGPTASNYITEKTEAPKEAEKGNLAETPVAQKATEQTEKKSYISETTKPEEFVAPSAEPEVENGVMQRSGIAPATEDMQGIAAYDVSAVAYDQAQHQKIICCYVTEESFEEAQQLLTPFEQAEQWTLVPDEQLSSVIDAVSQLPGFVSMESHEEPVETEEETNYALVEIRVQF